MPAEVLCRIGREEATAVELVKALNT